MPHGDGFGVGGLGYGRDGLLFRERQRKRPQWWVVAWWWWYWLVGSVLGGGGGRTGRSQVASYVAQVGAVHTLRLRLRDPADIALGSEEVGHQN